MESTRDGKVQFSSVWMGIFENQELNHWSSSAIMLNLELDLLFVDKKLLFHLNGYILV